MKKIKKIKRIKGFFFFELQNILKYFLHRIFFLDNFFFLFYFLFFSFFLFLDAFSILAFFLDLFRFFFFSLDFFLVSFLSFFFFVYMYTYQFLIVRVTRSTLAYGRLTSSVKSEFYFAFIASRHLIILLLQVWGQERLTIVLDWYPKHATDRVSFYTHFYHFDIADVHQEWPVGNLSYAR